MSFKVAEFVLACSFESWKKALISSFIAYGHQLYLLIAADTEAFIKIKDSATSS